MGVNKACGTGGCLCPKAKLLSGERGTDTAVYDAPGDQNLVPSGPDSDFKDDAGSIIRAVFPARYPVAE